MRSRFLALKNTLKTKTLDFHEKVRWFAFVRTVRSSYQVIFSDAPSKTHGAQLCEFLATSRSVFAEYRIAARLNMPAFSKKLNDEFPGLDIKKFRISFKNGCNPSVCRFNDKLYVNVRCSNYYFDRFQQWFLLGSNDYKPNSSEIITENVMAVFSDWDDLQSLEFKPVRFHGFPEKARYKHPKGAEDMRIFAVGDELFGSASVCEFSPDGIPQIMIGEITAKIGCYELSNCRIIASHDQTRPEKNWMPVVRNDVLRFVYSVDPLRVVDAEGRGVSEYQPSLALDHIRGGSQLVPYDDNYIALVHERSIISTIKYYRHRFIKFDKDLKTTAISPAFSFLGRRIEFAAGLAWLPGGKRMIASVGVDDSEAWLISFDPVPIMNKMRPLPV